MLDFSHEERCYHCGACAQKCPTGAIQMEMGNDGFLYPEINEEKCIHCGACDRVCPHLNCEQKMPRLEDRTCFAAASTINEQYKSASGGVFYSLARYFLQQGGYVAGCVWDDTLTARHIVTNRLDEVERMRGSKYVWSDTTEIFREISELLKRGEKVLFTGTPCQVAAANNYFGKQENLLTCGIFCHGNTSPQMFALWKKDMEAKYGKMENVVFRYHGPDGNDNAVQITFQSGKKVRQEINENRFMRGFSENYFGSESCKDEKCQYKEGNIPGDILIGDFWGYTGKKISKWMSAVICTPTGVTIFKKLEEECLVEILPSELSKITEKNGYLIHGTHINPLQHEFIEMAKQRGFLKAYNKLGTMSWYKNFLYKIKLGKIKKFLKK